MKVRAPGKLLLTGAYAVLEGAPAIVVAVDRYAVADTADGEAEPTREVREAFARGDGRPPKVDAGALEDDRGHKLGLGSSAAVLVASLGALLAARGDDLARVDVRDDLFARAREAHARAQGGGSGVDVAASVHGGTLRYQLRDAAADVLPVSLPKGLAIATFWCGESARTSDSRARVDALRGQNGSRHAALHRALGDAAERAARAVDEDDAGAFVRAARATGDGLDALGRAADAPLCTPAMAALGRRAEALDAAFLPSGAGGGDVAVYVGMRPPPEAFCVEARALRMQTLPLGRDRFGVSLVNAVRTEH